MSPVRNPHWMADERAVTQELPAEQWRPSLGILATLGTFLAALW